MQRHSNTTATIESTAAPANAAHEPSPTAQPAANDSLSEWAVWAMAFAILSVTLVGGAVGGLLAAFVSVPVTQALPVRADGRRIPVEISIALMVVAFLIFILGTAALLDR